MHIRRKRRLSVQHTSMDPEHVPLYPDDALPRLKLPIPPTLPPKDNNNNNDDLTSSTDMIVLGRSQRPFHSRTKKVCTSSSLIERLNRLLQQTMDTMRSSSSLDLHDYKFIPSNIDESNPANQSSCSSSSTTTQSSSSTTTKEKQRSLLSIGTIKKRRMLTMMIHPPSSPPLRLHKMILRSTTRRNKLDKNSNSPHTPSPQTP